MKEIILITSAFVLSLWVSIPASEKPTSVRLFCANHRVFIEFEEKNNTWGTMWLDNDGRPIYCNNDNEKINTGNII